MNWKFWKTKKEADFLSITSEPKYVEVGQVALLIHYLNEKNEVKSILQYLTGCACYTYNFDNEKTIEIISAKQSLSIWFKDAIKFGVYSIEDFMIPRERLLLIKTTFNQFEIEI